jgi:hypothetical protein
MVSIHSTVSGLSRGSAFCLKYTMYPLPRLRVPHAAAIMFLIDVKNELFSVITVVTYLTMYAAEYFFDCSPALFDWPIDTFIGVDWPLDG